MQKLYSFSILILFIVLTSQFRGLAQEQEYAIQVSLQWEPAKDLYPGHSILSFEGAVNHDSLGFLPVYEYHVPLEYTGKISGFSLLDEVYEPIVIGDPNEFPDLNLIGAEPLILLSTVYSRKIPQQSLCILPLRRIKEGGGYERLVSFGLKVSMEDMPSPLSSPNNTERSYAQHSVLSTGNWYRIGVKETGIYKITYQDLIGMGIDPEQTNPRNIRLFGNGNGMLAESNSSPRVDDLMENSIFIQGESDGNFDPEDYILFYGESPVTLRYNPFYLQYEHEINFYSDATFYFLNPGDIAGKRVTQEDPVAEEPTHEVYNFQDLAYHEKEELNLIKSGKIWYGEVFNTQLDHHFQFDLKDLDISEPLSLKVSLAGRSTTTTVFYVFIDDVLLTELDLASVVLGSQIYARPITSTYETFYADDEIVDIRISFAKHGTIDVGWLNYIELNYTRHLAFSGGQLSFRDTRPVGEGNIARYHIQDPGLGISCWDVTDPASIKAPVVSPEPGNYTFKASADQLREFIAFNGTQFFTPDFIEKVENQDLHSFQPVDFIVVAYPMFLEQANRLAEYHMIYDGMDFHVITPQQIYNEFSSGAQDVSAIRDFVKMLYDRAEPGDEPRYLLLFGDASYDYKGYLPENNNLVPAFQSRESLKTAASFVTDDSFGILDNDEGSNASGTVDIGVGRFPVLTVEQAEEMVDKTINYMMPVRENFGPWRNSICFVGDDEDNNTHLGQAEGLAEITDTLGPTFNINKVYLDAYPQLNTPSGDRYPDANEAINKAVNNGSLIINYTGHGGEIAWAGERVLDVPTILSYKNITRLPAFVTATCEFSRYDDPGLVSAGELVFLNSEGAGIGLFTTTRLAFSQSNYALNKRFYYDAFIIDEATGEYPRMGDLIKASKTPSNQNIKNFVLLGRSSTNACISENACSDAECYK